MLRKLTFLLLPLSLFPGLAGAGNFDSMKLGQVTFRYPSDLKGAPPQIYELMPSIKEDIHQKLLWAVDFDFEIVLYKDHASFGEMVENKFIGAFALPGDKRMVMDFSQMRRHPMKLRLTVTHELCHLVLHHYIGKGEIPKWLNEGISQWISGGVNEIVDQEGPEILNEAFLSNNLLEFKDLRNRFPSDFAGMVLAYQQSRSLVEFIEEEYGREGLRALLEGLRKGMDINLALRESLFIPMHELESGWRQSFDPRRQWVAYAANNIYLFLFSLGSLLTVFGYIRYRLRKKKYAREEEEKDAKRNHWVNNGG